MDNDFIAKENTSTCIGEIPLYYSDHRMLLIRWVANGEAGWNHYLCGYPPFELDWYKKFIEELEL